MDTVSTILLVAGIWLVVSIPTALIMGRVLRGRSR